MYTKVLAVLAITSIAVLILVLAGGINVIKKKEYRLNTLEPQDQCLKLYRYEPEAREVCRIRKILERLETKCGCPKEIL